MSASLILLRTSENRIKARGDRPGHPATSPRLLLALWLYATSEGVVVARRALKRLCESHDAYRWLCGVCVGETITCWRTFGSVAPICSTGCSGDHLAALAQAWFPRHPLETLAQDGVRVRASAGAASFRREASTRTASGTG